MRVLVSNTEINENRIGSWTSRFSKFISSNPSFFDFILSPSVSNDVKYLFCAKKSHIPFLPERFRLWELMNYRVLSYLRVFKKVYSPKTKINVLVIDDFQLLEAFARLKYQGYNFDLIFSFHGFSFNLESDWRRFVNKVFFLTYLGYLETKNINYDFLSFAYIVGNGVDSARFFPLTLEEKVKKRNSLNLTQNQRILVWLSNDRPKKGIHLMEKIAPELLDKYRNLIIWIVGKSSDYISAHPRIEYKGKVLNQNLRDILQLSDFYLFSSLCKEGFGLSLVEAIKCGNYPIVANNGGIIEVVKDVNFCQIVDYPNILDEWIRAFDLAWLDFDNFQNSNVIEEKFHCYELWEDKFIKAVNS
jgi:glycosyltransferase involved in cell wall biosynthesis